MRIAIYSPYLDTAGGGEKYMLTIAEALSQQEQVDVLLDQHLVAIGIEPIKQRMESFHGLDLSKVHFIPAPVGKGSSGIDRLLFLRNYDWLFYLTDGSVFYSSAKNSVIHFQVPFQNSNHSLKQRLKLSSWKMAIYNSRFTKDLIEKTWPIKGEIVYPPVSIDLFQSKNKKKQILSVGRFFSYDKNKKHAFLIETFSKLSKKKEAHGWSFHLAGGASEGDQEYLNELINHAKGLPIVFHPNIELKDLINLFGESSIYWHAKGFGESDPVKMEHFGITTVEAMAAGCVPVVINLGGQTEIIDQKKDGFLWDTQAECLGYTQKLMQDTELMTELSKQAINKAHDFSKVKFLKKIQAIVSGTTHAIY